LLSCGTQRALHRDQDQLRRAAPNGGITRGEGGRFAAFSPAATPRATWKLCSNSAQNPNARRQRIAVVLDHSVQCGKERRRFLVGQFGPHAEM
jgi:hypothetical protein